MAKFGITRLVRRGETYWFRMAVPRSLVSRISRREIKGSLKTSDPFTARLRCRRLSNYIDALLRAIRNMPELPSAKIRSLIRGYFQQCLNGSEEIAYLAPSDSKIDLSYEASELLAEAGALKSRLASQNYDNFTKSEVEEQLSKAGLHHGALDLEQLDQIHSGLLRARIEDRRILAAKLTGNYDQTSPLDPLFAGMQATGLPPIPGSEEKQSNGNSVGVLAGRYCEQKRNKTWVHKTYMDNKRVLNLVVDLLGGDRDIQSIEIDDVRQVRDVIAKLPSNYMKSKANQGKSLEAILSTSTINASISTTTQSKYFSNFRAFLNWCVDEGYLTSMPGPGIKLVGVSGGSAIDARYPFSSSQLHKLFQSPQYTGHLSLSRRHIPGELIIRDGKFWIPLVGLFTGLRLGEIVQLLAGDIRSNDGVTFIDLASHEGEAKQFKTASSKRRVPVHPMLIKIGFLDYVKDRQNQEPEGRLFPDIQPGKDGYASHNFSKWFSRYISAIGVKTAKTTFHSFRHNFKDALVHGSVSEPVAKSLMGHSDGTVHGIYGSHVPLNLLNYAILGSKYDLNITHLHVV